MASKCVVLAITAGFLTAINLVVLAANWSKTARADVAGMDARSLIQDRDFHLAVVYIVQNCSINRDGSIGC